MSVTQLPPRSGHSAQPLEIAVVGSGISGLSAAWLLSQRHRVTLFEAEPRLGGHSHTVTVPYKGGLLPVDTGFIVYNTASYPNLTALFAHLDVPTRATDMSFAVSLDGGALEYSGTNLAGLFAQKSNLARPRFWSMLSDLYRFYKNAPGDIAQLDLTTLGEYLDANNYGSAFRQDHLFPMAAAIWSTPASRVQDYPAAAFIRFCENHGLLKLTGRPIWRTVEGGSRVYVDRLRDAISDRVRSSEPVRTVKRDARGVTVETARGASERFDHVVLATHADQALRLLAEPTRQEREILGAFRYSRNETILHGDDRLMPQRRGVWASWNYLAERGRERADPSVTYWMNLLQGQPRDVPLFVSLNPAIAPREARVYWRGTYEHPLFDQAAIRAQDDLWSLQGEQKTWFCGAYFGSGFHEDGLQAGLAVAEELGGVRRPWEVADELARIRIARKQPAGMRIGMAS